MLKLLYGTESTENESDRKNNRNKPGLFVKLALWKSPQVVFQNDAANRALACKLTLAKVAWWKCYTVNITAVVSANAAEFLLNLTKS